mgnify:CR=1 FL=1
MQVPEAGKADDALVHARVVLHRARAERVEARVDHRRFGSARAVKCRTSSGSEISGSLRRTGAREAPPAPPRPEARARGNEDARRPGGTFVEELHAASTSREAVDLCGRPLLGHRDEQRVIQARVVTTERVARMDARRACSPDRVLAGRPTRTANSLNVAFSGNTSSRPASLRRSFA